jgi:hypothetical protein
MPVGWQAEEGEEGMISLYDPTSNGMLSFSAIKEDEDISDEYLEDLLSEHLEADAELYDVDYNDFSGVSCCYADEEEYWCEWYLRAGPVLLYITYYCPVEDEGLEEDLIESILESLTVPEHKILH